MAQAGRNLCVSRKEFPKHLVNWTTVCDANRANDDLPWRCMLLTIVVEVLNDHSSMLVGRSFPTR